MAAVAAVVVEEVEAEAVVVGGTLEEISSLTSGLVISIPFALE